MKIINETELMKNQKHAVLMAPDKQFEVLQSQEGNALFFSIGSDGVFYLTRETPEGTHGWSRIDLSSVLSAQNNNAKITAKLFDVAQDISGNTTDIAVVVTINGVDSLYMSTVNPNTDDDWATIAANGVAWTPIGFDAGNDNPATLNVTDINFCLSGQVDFLQADIIQGGSNAGDYINRYYIDPNQIQTGNYWNTVDLPSAISAGDIHNEVGYLYAEGTAGTYTLSGLKTLSGTEMELIFQPFWNAFSSDPIDPSHINFQLPANTTAMAPSQAIGSGDASDGTPDDTDLFVAAGSSLYFVPHQKETLGNVVSGLIYTHDNLSGVQGLHVNNTASKTVIWGLNENGDVFYMSCSTGSEATAAAWTPPAIINSGVEEVATYINGTQNSLVIFTSLGNGSMEQLTQDPVTSHWIARDIHLPTTDPMDMVENYTFTTHIQLTDDNNMPYQNQPIIITANTTCSLYINDIYHVLYTAIPLNFTCDATGVITLVQTVDTLAGVCFTLTDDNNNNVIVNPMTNVLANLKGKCAADGSGPDLHASVYDEMGTPSTMVPSTTDTTAIAQYIAQFIAAQNDVPADGSQQQNLEAAVYSPVATPDKVYGVYYKDGKMLYYEGLEAATNMRALFKPAQQPAAGLLGDSSGDDSLEVLAGDGWRWLKHKVEDVVYWEIRNFGGINHFIFKIAEIEYHLVIRALHDIANGIHFVLNKIAVAFEDLVKWLGSIFAWKDILNTHAVLKEYYLKYFRHCVTNIGYLQTQVNSMADTVNTNISKLTGLPADTCTSSSAQNNSDSGQHKPSSNWGTHQTKGNAANGQTNHTTSDPTSLMGALLTAVENEGDTIANAAQQLDGVFNEIGKQSASDIMAQVVGVLAETFVSSTANVMDGLLQVAEDVLTDAEQTMDAPIYIPVLSPVYKMFAHADLSILDVICLLTAIPVTVIYKLVNDNTAPFSSDDVTTFANAADFQAIAALLFETPVSQAAPGMLGIDTPPELKTGKLYDILEFAGNIGAPVGSIIIVIASTIKANAAPALDNSKIMAGILWGAYFAYVGPDILGQAVVLMESENTWYDIMNTVCAGLGCIKATFDLIMVCIPKPAANASVLNINRPALATKPLAIPLHAPVLVGAGEDGDDDDDLDPPPPNPNQNPPQNPDPPGPDPDGPQPDNQPENGPEQNNPGADIPAGAGVGAEPKPVLKLPDSKLSWDFISPVLDCALNAVWNIPVGFVFANSNKEMNDIFGLVGNLAFNVSGMIAPLTAWGMQGPAKWWFVGITDVCNLAYGALSAAISLDKQPVDS